MMHIVDEIGMTAIVALCIVSKMLYYAIPFSKISKKFTLIEGCLRNMYKAFF